MEPVGFHRACAACGSLVHDLSSLEVEEVEALLSDDPSTCVRARINAAGVVETKAGRGDGMRRMVIIAGASAGLLISPPLLAQAKHSEGAIVGNAETFGIETKIVAQNEAGRAFHAKIRADGRYRLRHVPAGIYTLHFIPNCGSRWTISNVTVGNGETVVPSSHDNGGCVVVGRLEIIEHRG
jgi:hypothetical protein